MEITDFLGITVVGILLSLAVQLLKEKWPAKPVVVKLLTLTFSVLVGGAYWFLRDTPIWPTIIGVLTTASAVWALLLKNDAKE
jgi:hypothetical protein